jgi:hypothetical protein
MTSLRIVLSALSPYRALFISVCNHVLFAGNVSPKKSIGSKERLLHEEVNVGFVVFLGDIIVGITKGIVMLLSS